MHKFFLLCLASVLMAAVSVTAHDKVVVVPMGSSAKGVDGADGNRLWGKGMPGSKLLTHSDPNGYCTSNTGIKYALSYHLLSWEAAEKGCPAGTWVCSSNDLSTEVSCPIVEVSTYYSVACNGDFMPTNPIQQTSLLGLVADLRSDFPFYTVVINSADFSKRHNEKLCLARHVWCCWE